MIIPLTKTELEDLFYLLNKICNNKPFYALEINKARYLTKRIVEIKALEDTQ